MLTVETIARIRREHAKGKSIRAIARALKVSRETVSKYLRSGETAPRYERQHQPYPQLGAFQRSRGMSRPLLQMRGGCCAPEPVGSGCRIREEEQHP
jgi:IS30 family transposase